VVCSLSSEHRDTEAFESVAEDEQLPQVLDELHDLFLSPGAPIAKMSVKVKGQLCFFFFMDANSFVSESILSLFCLFMHCLFQVFPFLNLHLLYLLLKSSHSEHDINVLHSFFWPSYF